MWDAAIAIRYLGPAFEREAKALEAFDEALTLFGKMAAEGICAEPEVFHHLVGGGLMIIKTETIEKAVEILEMENVRKLFETCLYCVEEFEVELMVTGEKVLHNVKFYGEVGAELGYL